MLSGSHPLEALPIHLYHQSRALLAQSASGVYALDLVCLFVANLCGFTPAGVDGSEGGK
jgi:hypothetical protein